MISNNSGKIAEEILKKYDIADDAIEHICKIIASHHSARGIDTLEFRIVWDADWLVNIPVEFPDVEQGKIRRIIDETFKTQEGRRIATDLFSKS